jgi:hypothetical protein
MRPFCVAGNPQSEGKYCPRPILKLVAIMLILPHYMALKPGVHKFSKCLVVNYRRQKSDMVHFHTDDLQILGATVHNLVVTVIWRLGFVNP